MFLYDNNIISSNYLSIASEPTNDFVAESFAYNREAIAASLDASRVMLETINEYGHTNNIITEAFDDFKNKIIEIIRNFKAKVIVLFRRWIDWISKKLGGGGRYRIESAKALLADNARCKALAGFRYELPEPTDFGFTYFNELTNPYFPNQVVLKAAEITKNLLGNKKFEFDVKKMRDEFQSETNSYLNGSKTSELDIRSFENVVKLLDNADKTLDAYKKTVINAIQAIEKHANRVGNLTNLAASQAACNAILAMVTCLNEHLTAMASNFAIFVGRIHKVIAEFLPLAEEYLIRNDN